MLCVTHSAGNQYVLGVLGASIPAMVAELALNVPALSTGITGFFLRWTIRLLASACLFGGWRFTRMPLMKWWGWGVVTGLVLAILILVFLKVHFGLTTY